MGKDAVEKPAVPKPPPKPAGVLPKNVQAWAILAVALLMVGVIVLEPIGTGPKRPEGAAPAQPPAPPSIPDESRIEEYRRRMEEEARRLAAERARLERELAEEALPASPPLPPAYAASPPRERDAIAQEKREREYRSLFASNIALTYRSEPQPGNGPQAAAAPRKAPAPTAAAPQDAAAEARPDDDPEPMHRLREGTVIEAVLSNRLAGEFPGPVNCMVTTGVYSEGRRHLLIPQGSRLLGRAERVERFGQARLAVAFHRLMLPNGLSLSLEGIQGLSQQGETALKGKVNRHYLSIFGSALALGAIGGLTQAGTRFGFETSSGDAARQGAASSLGRSSERILDRFLNRLPTITIREGTRVKAYLAGDLYLPAYDPGFRPQPPKGESP